jgi:hypothetical protein
VSVRVKPGVESNGREIVRRFKGENWELGKGSEE